MRQVYTDAICTLLVQRTRIVAIHCSSVVGSNNAPAISDERQQLLAAAFADSSEQINNNREAVDGQQRLLGIKTIFTQTLPKCAGAARSAGCRVTAPFPSTTSFV